MPDLTGPEMMECGLSNKLRQLMCGRVLAGAEALRTYCRDQSIYRVCPLVVVLPTDSDDIQRLVRFAGREGLPLTARGGGSGTAGAALGEGIVLALPGDGEWGRIGGFSMTPAGAEIEVGAGVLHRRVQEFLRARGYFLPADVSSAGISCLGGNIATRASGPHALRYGAIDRFLLRLRFVTARGEWVDTGEPSTIPSYLRQGLAELSTRLRGDGPARTQLATRAGLKSASGYNLAVLLEELPPGQQLARLLAGSVGSLGLITGATLRVEPYPAERGAMLLAFESLSMAGAAVGALRQLEVAAIEIISRETVRLLRQRLALPPEMAADAHLLLVEAVGPGWQGQLDRISRCLATAGCRLAAEPTRAEGDAAIARLWALRSSILWMIRQPAPHLRALAVVNDVGVPLPRLAEFISEVQQLFDRHGIEALIYGHAGDGNLHLRPLFDVNRPLLAERIRRLADDVYGLVLRMGGTITAEHGMGRLRAPYLQQEWGPAVYGYMRQLKELFDPHGLLNPGVMFTERLITEHMAPAAVLRAAE